MKVFLVTTAIVVITVFIAVLVMFINTQSEPNLDVENPQPTTPGGQSGNTQTVPIEPDAQLPKEVLLETVDGRSLKVANFKAIDGVLSVGDGMFHLDGAMYSVLYNEENSSFAIQLSQKPILQIRQLAVEALAKSLDVEPVMLCAINIYVGTTADIDPEFSGKNLGIGVCGN